MITMLQAPGTDWMSVMECLDHEGFYIPNEGAFSFFMSIYARVSQVCFTISDFFLIPCV